MSDTTTNDLPDGLTPDDVVMPEGHEIDDVSGWKSDVEAYVGTDPHAGFAFNPQNGRKYEERDPGCANYDSTTAVAGLTINCAYRDCTGYRTVEMSETIDSSCPECGERAMGRSQFSSGSRAARERRRSIADETADLRDDFAQEMARLTDAGIGAIAANDYLMCSIGDVPYEEWADARGVDKYAVRRNLRKVARTLGETVNFSTRGGA